MFRGLGFRRKKNKDHQKQPKPMEDSFDVQSDATVFFSRSELTALEPVMKKLNDDKVEIFEDVDQSNQANDNASYCCASPKETTTAKLEKLISEEDMVFESPSASTVLIAREFWSHHLDAKENSDIMSPTSQEESHHHHHQASTPEKMSSSCGGAAEDGKNAFCASPVSTNVLKEKEGNAPDDSPTTTGPGESSARSSDKSNSDVSSIDFSSNNKMKVKVFEGDDNVDQDITAVSTTSNPSSEDDGASSGNDVSSIDVPSNTGTNTNKAEVLEGDSASTTSNLSSEDDVASSENEVATASKENSDQIKNPLEAIDNKKPEEVEPDFLVASDHDSSKTNQAEASRRHGESFISYPQHKSPAVNVEPLSDGDEANSRQSQTENYCPQVTSPIVDSESSVDGFFNNNQDHDNNEELQTSVDMVLKKASELFGDEFCLSKGPHSPNATHQRSPSRRSVSSSSSPHSSDGNGLIQEKDFQLSVDMVLKKAKKLVGDEFGLECSNHGSGPTIDTTTELESPPALSYQVSGEHARGPSGCNYGAPDTESLSGSSQSLNKAASVLEKASVKADDNSVDSSKNELNDAGADCKVPELSVENKQLDPKGPPSVADFDSLSVTSLLTDEAQRCDSFKPDCEATGNRCQPRIPSSTRSSQREEIADSSTSSSGKIQNGINPDTGETVDEPPGRVYQFPSQGAIREDPDVRDDNTKADQTETLSAGEDSSKVESTRVDHLKTDCKETDKRDQPETRSNLRSIGMEETVDSCASSTGKSHNDTQTDSAEIIDEPGGIGHRKDCQSRKDGPNGSREEGRESPELCSGNTLPGPKGPLPVGVHSPRDGAIVTDEVPRIDSLSVGPEAVTGSNSCSSHGGETADYSASSSGTTNNECIADSDEIIRDPPGTDNQEEYQSRCCETVAESCAIETSPLETKNIGLPQDTVQVENGSLSTQASRESSDETPGLVDHFAGSSRTDENSSDICGETNLGKTDCQAHCELTTKESRDRENVVSPQNTKHQGGSRSIGTQENCKSSDETPVPASPGTGSSCTDQKPNEACIETKSHSAPRNRREDGSKLQGDYQSPSKTCPANSPLKSPLSRSSADAGSLQGKETQLEQNEPSFSGNQCVSDGRSVCFSLPDHKSPEDNGSRADSTSVFCEHKAVRNQKGCSKGVSATGSDRDGNCVNFMAMDSYGYKNEDSHVVCSNTDQLAKTKSSPRLHRGCGVDDQHQSRRPDPTKVPVAGASEENSIPEKASIGESGDPKRESTLRDQDKPTENQCSYEWAYKVWIRKGLMSERKQTARVPKSTCEEGGSVLSKLMTPRESTMDLDLQGAEIDKQDAGCRTRWSLPAGTVAPQQGSSNEEFTKILQKWRKKSDHKPNSHFLSPEQSPLQSSMPVSERQKGVTDSCTQTLPDCSTALSFKSNCPETVPQTSLSPPIQASKSKTGYQAAEQSTSPPMSCRATRASKLKAESQAGEQPLKSPTQASPIKSPPKQALKLKTGHQAAEQSTLSPMSCRATRASRLKADSQTGEKPLKSPVTQVSKLKASFKNMCHSNRKGLRMEPIKNSTPQFRRHKSPGKSRGDYKTLVQDVLRKVEEGELRDPRNRPQPIILGERDPGCIVETKVPTEIAEETRRIDTNIIGKAKPYEHTVPSAAAKERAGDINSQSVVFLGDRCESTDDVTDRLHQTKKEETIARKVQEKTTEEEHEDISPNPSSGPAEQCPGTHSQETDSEGEITKRGFTEEGWCPIRAELPEDQNVGILDLDGEDRKSREKFWGDAVSMLDKEQQNNNAPVMILEDICEREAVELVTINESKIPGAGNRNSAEHGPSRPLSRGRNGRVGVVVAGRCSKQNSQRVPASGMPVYSNRQTEEEPSLGYKREILDPGIPREVEVNSELKVGGLPPRHRLVCIPPEKDVDATGGLKDQISDLDHEEDDKDSTRITPRDEHLCGQLWEALESQHTQSFGDQTDSGEESTCQCSTSIFSGNDALIDFFLPLMGMACTCGKRSRKLTNPLEPTSLENILRPWQVEFLAGFGIYRGDQLVKANHRSAKALANSLRQYRRKHGMVPFRTKSCAMAVQIWSKTCKAFVRSIRSQLMTGTNELKLPNTINIVSSLLKQIPGDPPKASTSPQSSQDTPSSDTPRTLIDAESQVEM